MAPRVSVVLPTRDRAATLGRSLASVLGQTFDDLELIVVDDGSTDGTVELLDAVDDERLLRVRLEGRNGPAVARNAGLRQAAGSLVAFQDSDDEWSPTKLAAQVARLDAAGDGLGGVGGAYRVEAPGPTTTVRSRALEAGRDYERDLLEGPCCITPVWLLRRAVVEQVGGFDEGLPCLEDWDLMLRISAVVPLAAVPEVVLHKHGSPDSLGADLRRRATALAAIQRRHAPRWRAHRHDDAKLHLELAYLDAVDGRRAAALAHLGRGARHRAIGPASLLRLATALRHAHRHGPQCWPARG